MTDVRTDPAETTDPGAPAPVGRRRGVRGRHVDTSVDVDAPSVVGHHRTVGPTVDPTVGPGVDPTVQQPAPAAGQPRSAQNGSAQNGSAQNGSAQNGSAQNGSAQPGTAPSGHDGAPAPDPARWWTLVAVCLGTFMLLLDVTIINVALPDIQTDLQSSFSGLQWVVDAYALTLAALLLTAGSVADMFGRRRVYLVGLSVFTIASVLCGLATSTLALQLSRGLQGVGGAVMFAVSLALLAGAFQGRERGTAFGIWGAITGLAVAIGPLLGGLLTSALSWRWIFLVNLPIGIVAVVIVATKVAESKARGGSRPDWPGFVVFSAALACLVFGLIESNERSFSDPLIIGLLAAAVVLLAAFVAIELRSPHAMFDLRLLRLPTFSGGAIAAFGVSSTIFAMILYLTLYLQDVLRFTALQTGVRFLVLSAGILLTSTIAGRLSTKVPVRLLIGPGLGVVGIGLLLMRGLDAGSSWTHLLPGLFVAGFGVGMVNPPLASTAVGVVPPQQAGMASGINSTFRQIGIATGIALLGTLFASRVTSEVVTRTAAVPGLSGRGPEIAAAVRSGNVGGLMGQLPPQLRGTVETITRSAFTAGLDRILLVAAVVALAAGVASLLLIRDKDFAAARSAAQGGARAGS